MKIDKKTEQYFSNIEQVFLYVSDKCNLLCKQCLYKPNVINGKKIDIKVSKKLLFQFKKLGAFKLTVLGGEISLVDIDNNYKELIELLSYAHEVGYKYIRIDTNGQIQDFFNNKDIFKYIDEVSFSIDGYNAETNDILRGKGSFDKAISNLQNARDNDIKINITTCITAQNTKVAGGIVSFIENMIAFSTKIKIDQLNFHGVFRMGVPMDSWVENSFLDPEEWYRAASEVSENIANKKYNIDVRFPIHIIKKDQFEQNPRYYGYCPCKLGERALIHPDGIIRVCSSMLSTPYGVAHYNENKIVWNEYNNELNNHKMNEYTACTNQKALYVDDYLPICFSIKPYQNEPVWKKNNVEKLRGK